MMRNWFTLNELHACLNAVLRTSWHAFAFQLVEEGDWLPGVSVIRGGELVHGVDCGDTGYPTHAKALGAAYRIAVQRAADERRRAAAILSWQFAAYFAPNAPTHFTEN